jgi:hypothetical protein
MKFLTFVADTVLMASKNIPPKIISALQLASDIRTEVKSQNELLDNMVRLCLDHCVTEPVDMNSINTGTFLEVYHW